MFTKNSTRLHQTPIALAVMAALSSPIVMAKTADVENVTPEYEKWKWLLSMLALVILGLIKCRQA